MSGLYVYSVSQPCARVVEYAIGTFDERFDVEKSVFLEELQTAERIWEEAAQRELFSYNPEARFTVNLLYDDRQAKTEQALKSSSVLDQNSEVIEKQRSELESLEQKYQENTRSFDALQRSYEARLEEYNDQVAYWNARGGAPPEVYEELQQEEAALDTIFANLSRRMERLNQEVAQIRSRAENLERDISLYNSQVDRFNSEYGSGEEFNQGLFRGNRIDIYQFTSREDLRAVLAHEFGHALGLDHVDDPEAVMYYLMDEQAFNNVSLTETDTTELLRTCEKKRLFGK